MQHNSEHKDRLMKERDIRILLVDDHDLVLQGLKRIVECSLPEIKNVCTASSGQEALHLIASQRFNLFVLDMELPDISGMDIIVRIREKDPRAEKGNPAKRLKHRRKESHHGSDQTSLRLGYPKIQRP